MTSRASHIIPDYPADRPKVPEVLPLVRALYSRKGGGAGCCLHCILDDNNMGRAFLRSAVEEAQHKDCQSIASLLNQMTPTQVRKICTSKK